MGKRQEIRNRREQKLKRQQRTVLVIVLVFAIAITSIIILQSLKPVGEVKPLNQHNHAQVDGLNMGDPNASVTVEEFSDFQCIACSQWWQNIEQDFIDKYVASGKVYFTYQPFSFIGPESFQAAEAAFCANDQQSFWPYHDMVFSNWNGENVGNFSDERLIAFGATIGLNENELKSCLNSNQYEEQVKQGVVYGNQKGVQGTPSFLINGEQLVGAGDLYAALDAIIK